MKKTVKKAAAVFLALVMVLSIAIMAVGCGKKDEKKSSKTKATTQAVETTEAVIEDDETQVQSVEDNQAEDDEDDGYMDEQTALAKVKEQAGSGSSIDSYYKGTAPDGQKAWVVTVIPVTTDNGPETVIYYVNDGFCYADLNSASDSDSNSNSNTNSSKANTSKSNAGGSSGSYIDKDTAIATVKQQAGSGATIKGAKKGTAPDGKKAWVVTVAPITNGQGPDTVTYYVNDGFCYMG